MFVYNGFKRFLIVVTFLIIGGCSLVTLSYNRLPFLALLELDSVFDLNDEQKKLVRPKLDSWLEWHRNKICSKIVFERCGVPAQR